MFAKTEHWRQPKVALCDRHKQRACASVRQSLRTAIGTPADFLSHDFICAVIATYFSVPHAVDYLIRMHTHGLLTHLDNLLFAWRVHKKNWNYTESDRLRCVLNHHGVRAEAPFLHMQNVSVDDLLDLWVRAKRGRNFHLADVLRMHLESLGHYPEFLRPKNPTKIK